MKINKRKRKRKRKDLHSIIQTNTLVKEAEPNACRVKIGGKTTWTFTKRDHISGSQQSAGSRGI